MSGTSRFLQNHSKKKRRIIQKGSKQSKIQESDQISISEQSYEISANYDSSVQTEMASNTLQLENEQMYEQIPMDYSLLTPVKLYKEEEKP